MPRQMKYMLALAAVGFLWVAVAVTVSMTTDGERPRQELEFAALRLAESAADESAATTDHTGADVEKSAEIDAKEAVSSLQFNSQNAVPLADTPDDDAPYGGSMRRGSTRLALRRHVPMEWIRQCLESVDEVVLLTAVGDLLTPELIELIAETRNVRNIRFGGELSDEAAAMLNQLYGVEGLEMHSPLPYGSHSPPTEEEYNSTVEAFLRMPDLVSFETPSVFTVNDDFLARIARAGHLSRLVLRNYPDLRRANLITTDGIKHLSHLKNLRELELKDFALPGHRIDLDQLGELLAAFPVLERLSLAGWQISDRHLKNGVATLKRLTALNVRGTLLGDEFYGRIGSDWRLQELYASDGIGDAGLSALSALGNLSRLDVMGASITDSGLTSLSATASRLGAVNVSYCEALTDAGLSHLASLPLLRELQLSGLHSLSEEAVLHAAGACNLRLLAVAELRFVTPAFVNRVATVAPELGRLYILRCPNLGKSDVAALAGKYPNIQFRLQPFQVD